MYFLFDSSSQSAQAFKKRGDASRVYLAKIGIEVPKGADPVKLEYENSSDDMAILSLSDAFESIAESEGDTAQALAMKFKSAVDEMFSEQRK